MDIDAASITNAPPSCYFILTPADYADATKACRDELIDHMDTTDQIQSEILLEEVLDNSNLYQSVIKRAKVGSRWGKSVLDLYREFLESKSEPEDDISIAEDIENQFQKYGVSAYSSGVVGEPINIGIKTGERIKNQLSAIGSGNIEFTEADLTTAVGIAADKQKISGENRGVVIIKSDRSISDLKRYDKIGSLPTMMTEIILSGLSVVVIAPDNGTDESEVIKRTFRSAGQVSINYVEPTSIDVSADTTEWIESWYDRLCFDIAPGQISQRTARRAAIVAHDLPNRVETAHFRRSIIHGLQWKYSNQRLGNHKDDFDELWDEKIKSHKEYDYHRSRRNSFPRVKIGRDDGRVRQFELRYRGAKNQIKLDGTTITDDPVHELINKILKFLDGEVVGEEQWDYLKTTIPASLVDQLDTTPEVLVTEGLLYQGQLPPKSANIQRTSEVNTENSMQNLDWYKEHWRSILSEPTVRSRVGSKLIEKKIKLRDSLTGDQAGDSALYYKLQKDISRAEEIYVKKLSREVSRGVIDHISLEVNKESFDEYEEVIYHAETVDGRTRTVRVRIKIPYTDVRVSGKKASPATIDNVAEIIIDHFGQLFQIDSDITSPTDILVPLLDLYIDMKKLSEGDLLYFEEFISFCVTLPGIMDRFKRSRSASEVIGNHLNDDQIAQALRERSSKFILAGSDNYKRIEISDKLCVAIELGTVTENK